MPHRRSSLARCRRAGGDTAGCACHAAGAGSPACTACTAHAAAGRSGCTTVTAACTSRCACRTACATARRADQAAGTACCRTARTAGAASASHDDAAGAAGAALTAASAITAAPARRTGCQAASARGAAAAGSCRGCTTDAAAAVAGAASRTAIDGNATCRARCAGPAAGHSASPAGTGGIAAQCATGSGAGTRAAIGIAAVAGYIADIVDHVVGDGTGQCADRGRGRCIEGIGHRRCRSRAIVGSCGAGGCRIGGAAAVVVRVGLAAVLRGRRIVVSLCARAGLAHVGRRCLLRECTTHRQCDGCCKQSFLHLVLADVVFLNCPQCWGLNRYRKLDATRTKLLKLLDFDAATQQVACIQEVALSRNCDRLVPALCLLS